MPNDAKLGLVTGLAIVVLIAATYYRKEPTGALASEAPAAPAVPTPPRIQPKEATPPAVQAPPVARPEPPMPSLPPRSIEDPFAPENSQKLVPLPPPPAPDDSSGPMLPLPSFVPRVD